MYVLFGFICLPWFVEARLIGLNTCIILCATVYNDLNHFWRKTVQIIKLCREKMAAGSGLGLN